MGARKAGRQREVVAGDVTDEEALREALAGCAGVIFCASARGRWEAQAVSHLGAANTARVAKDLGAKVRE